MARLRSQEKLKSLLAGYFKGMKSPLAWCTSAGPAEILRALGFEVYFPENHGALLGASRTAAKYIPRAHQAGYGPEICSYLTADIGAYLMGETPLKEAYGLNAIPKPDLIVYNTNQCREVADWFAFFGKEFSCPVVGINPPRHLDEVSAADVRLVVSQFEKLIAVGEEVIGRRLDPSRLAETVRLSGLASECWKQVLATAKHRPTPLTFWDGTILMAPIVILRGTQLCLDFYREALAELESMAKRDEGAVPKERVRIFWEGMPIWPRLRAFSELFAENHAAVVASTYCNSWVFDHFDTQNPLESMAYDYTQIFINRSEHAKLEMLKGFVRDFAIDGVIFHDSKTCFNNANCRFGMPDRLRHETGLATLTINGDLNDVRFFSDGQARTRFETFVEQLKESRNA